MKRQVVVACLLVVLSLSAGASVTTAQESSASGLAAQPEGFDQTTFEITMMENGSARWAIKHHRRLANETETQDFQDFAETFENNETELFRNFVSRADALTDVGANTTGRPMEAHAFGRAAYTNVTASFEDRGTIELQFTWMHFAQTEGDRVIVGDVFGENFYIGPNQAIVFVRDADLQFAEARPDPTSMTQPDSLTDSQSLSWEGERTFAQNRPYVVLEPRQTETTTAGPATDGETTTAATRSPDTGTDATGTTGGATTMQSTATTEPLGTGTSNPMVWLVGVLIVVLGISSAVAYRTRSGSLPGRTSDPPTETADQSTATGSTTDSQTPIPDEELLSDSDRVVSLLEDNGGRMKQVNIVDETDWSKSKVSMLLSDMEEDGEISKLRVGRENIISLAGHEPDAAGSPFDDDE